MSNVYGLQCTFNTQSDLTLALFDTNMSDYFKYLLSSDEDLSWGLHLNVAGASTVHPRSKYPLPLHPTSHLFNWDNGRTLNEYQLNYITNGSGTFETNEGSFKVTPGTILLITPNRWHRYRPDYSTGWTEHFVGFNGPIAQQLFQHELLQKPIIKIGFQEKLMKEFNTIVQLIKDEKPGFQQVCASHLMVMLAEIVSIHKNSEFANKNIERIIRKACIYLRDNQHQNVNIEKLSANYNVGYSYFRRMFKKYTGMSPYQYHLSLRIQKAKELIQKSDKSIKEISFELGFESLFYFSRIFKNKEGISPSQLRNSEEGE